jgi:hypothetical protein
MAKYMLGRGRNKRSARATLSCNSSMLAGCTGLECVGRTRTGHREKKGDRAFRGRRRETKPLEPRRVWWGFRGISRCRTQNQRRPSLNAGSWRPCGRGWGDGGTAKATSSRSQCAGWRSERRREWRPFATVRARSAPTLTTRPHLDGFGRGFRGVSRCKTQNPRRPSSNAGSWKP